MKKTYFACLIVSFFTYSAIAQSTWSVPEQNAGLLTKITATWCGPCGSWGWDAMEEIVDGYNDDHIVTALYASSSSELYVESAETFANEIGFGGYPNFAGNGEDQGTAHQDAMGVVDAFESAPVAANAAYEILEVKDNEITILVKVKFFEGGNGTFVLNNFLVEDHVIEEQASQGPDAEHHNVYRGKMEEVDGDGTNTVTDGSVSAGDEFEMTYTITVDPEWDYDYMFIATTLWMADESNPSDLLYVNGTKEPQAGELVDGYASGGGGGNGGTGGGSTDPDDWPIGVQDVDQENVKLYPNPAVEFFTVEQSGSDMVTVKVSDLLGKVVFTGQYTTSKNDINVSDFPEGIYMVEVSTASNVYLQRLVVK